MYQGDLPEDDFDAIVIGSGFGASVAAFHLAEAGKRVCVLERGKAYPPGSFPRSPSGFAENFWDPPSGRHGMFEAWTFSGIDALVSSGLGGGSLIYANVLIRKDPSWFVQHHPYRRGVDEAWPVGYDDLEPHYEAVEDFLSVQRLPFDTEGFHLTKTAALQEASEAIGGEADWHLAPLGVRFVGADGPVVGGPLPDEPYPNIHGLPRRTCRHCGECDVGCNDGAKNTLDHTYISAAAHLGALVSVRSEVRHLRRLPDGGFEVDFVVHQPDAEGRPVRVADLPPQRLRSRIVVVGCGTLGSTKLLLRNRRELGITSPALGSRFCGNGDMLGFILGAGGDTPRALDCTHGPVITSYTRFPDWVDGANPADLGMYIEDAGYPSVVEWLAETSQLGGTVGRAAHIVSSRVRDAVGGRHRSSLSGDLADLLGDGHLSSTLMPLLGMGRDIPDGTLYLDDPDRDDTMLQSTWSTATSAAYFERVAERMRALAAALGGRLEVNPTYLLRRVITVHPLGGCPMSTDPSDGVVDGLGGVWGVPGLFVCDGSVMPGPVGPNPSLTIAAFSRRASERMVEAV